ncbi:DUF1697 domain-containing protein [Sphingomonas cavernae]|uniref:DUF1697 domain-containing protein n=1 Tax=Sphingomonas cavernae TaxID=2320861 RepID=A0A418WQI4_9SPHN|nr:DUF1697 domain-containing protein [Sphingomonas cavernae]RJF93512.1 DUF1697 domain-containing protein [Sphingomonas cavernae]
MTVFVALLRAINVGKRQLPMAELRKLCAELGFDNPETYIASGNLLIGAEASADDVRSTLEKAITERFGFPVDVIVRAGADWAAYRDCNPFANDPHAQAKMVHLALPRDPIKPGAIEALRERAVSGERIEEACDAIWIDYGDSGVAGSKLTPAYIDKVSGSPVTGRNWNTVLKLQAMIEARA